MPRQLYTTRLRCFTLWNHTSTLRVIKVNPWHLSPPSRCHGSKPKRLPTSQFIHNGTVTKVGRFLQRSKNIQIMEHIQKQRVLFFWMIIPAAVSANQLLKNFPTDRQSKSTVEKLSDSYHTGLKVLYVSLSTNWIIHKLVCQNVKRGLGSNRTVG